jgi:hypothetical protein
LVGALVSNTGTERRTSNMTIAPWITTGPCVCCGAEQQEDCSEWKYPARWK